MTAERECDITYLGLKMTAGRYRAAQTFLIIVLTVAGFALWAWERLAAPDSWLGRNAWWIVLLLLTAECIEAIYALRLLAANHAKDHTQAGARPPRENQKSTE